ncbi:MAG: TonB family protein, partial [Paracraurococcus sp.]
AAVRAGLPDALRMSASALAEPSEASMAPMPKILPAEAVAAEIPLPPPSPPPPEPVAARPPAPMAPPPQPAPAPSPQVRLGAGVALNTAPGPDTQAARPRDIACSDATEYPEELRQAGIGGDVVLRLRLTDKGRVIEAKVAQSSGHPHLDEAVRRSVRRCRFDPALRDGMPVWSSLTWRVTFRP